MTVMQSLLGTTRRQAVFGLASAGIWSFVIYGFVTRSADADSGTPPKVFSSFMTPTSLRLQSAESVNHNTKHLRFNFPQSDATSGLGLMSSVLTFSWPKGRFLPVVRPYTPISSLNDPGHLDLLVKHYPGGKASTHLHSLAPGDTLYFLGALKGYQWTANKVPHVMLIAGGAGITPIYQLIQGILSNPEDKTKITLVFGVNTDADVLLKKEFDAYTQRHPGRFEAFYTVSNPVEGSLYRKGYVNKALLEEVTAAHQREDSLVFVCGPPPMEAALTGGGPLSGGEGAILKQLGYKKDQIHKC